MNKQAMILKSDASGRVVVQVERQVELVQEFERSGPRFAVMAGLKYQTFATWRRIGHHPASAGRLVGGDEPIRPRPPPTPFPLHVQGNSPRPP